MTAARRRAPEGAEGVSRDLMRRTLEALTLLLTRSDHLAQRVPNEHRGNCIPTCTKECQLVRGVVLDWIERAEARLAEAER